MHRLAEYLQFYRQTNKVLYKYSIIIPTWGTIPYIVLYICLYPFWLPIIIDRPAYNCRQACS